MSMTETNETTEKDVVEKPQIQEADKPEKDKGEGFFRRNAWIIALLSALIGLSSLAATCNNNNIQNARWAALNKPKFHVGPSVFYTFAEISESEISKSWAPKYKPSIYPIFKDFTFTGKYGVLSAATLIDNKTDKPIFGLKPMQTEEDVNTEAQRLRLGVQDYRLAKHYRIRFDVHNLSQMTASNVEVITFTKLGDKAAEEMHGQPNKIEIEAGKSNAVEFDFYDAPEASTISGQSVVSFRILIIYDFEGEEQKKEFRLTYFPNQNRWSPLS